MYLAIAYDIQPHYFDLGLFVEKTKYMKEYYNQQDKDLNGSGSNDSLPHVFCKKSTASRKACAFYFSTNSQLIEHLGFKDAAYYAKLKSTYRNGTIYNFSVNKVAKILNCSHSTANRIVRRFTNEGLMKKHEDNICFVNLFKIAKFKKFKRSNIKVFKIEKKTINELKDIFALALINRKVNQQKHSIKKQDSPKGNEAVKSLNAIAPERLAIGMRKMANYLGISLSALSALVKRFKDKFGLHLHQVKTCVGKVEGEIYTDAFDRYAFKSKKGNLIVHYGSLYSFTRSLDKTCIL